VLKGFMDEHLVVTDKLLAFEASMILVRVARVRRLLVSLSARFTRGAHSIAAPPASPTVMSSAP
jgi:hypothetical protein